MNIQLLYIGYAVTPSVYSSELYTSMALNHVVTYLFERTTMSYTLSSTSVEVSAIMLGILPTGESWPILT